MYHHMWGFETSASNDRVSFFGLVDDSHKKLALLRVFSFKESLPAYPPLVPDGAEFGKYLSTKEYATRCAYRKSNPKY